MAGLKKESHLHNNNILFFCCPDAFDWALYAHFLSLCLCSLPLHMMPLLSPSPFWVSYTLQPYSQPPSQGGYPQSIPNQWLSYLFLKTVSSKVGGQLFHCFSQSGNSALCKLGWISPCKTSILVLPYSIPTAEPSIMEGCFSLISLLFFRLKIHSSCQHLSGFCIQAAHHLCCSASLLYCGKQSWTWCSIPSVSCQHSFILGASCFTCYLSC